MKIDYIVDPHKYLLMPGFLELSITLKIVHVSITRTYAYIYVYVCVRMIYVFTSFRSVNNPGINNNDIAACISYYFYFHFFS